MSQNAIELIQNIDVDVSDAEYLDWKKWFEALPDHEKIGHFTAAVAQFILGPCYATASILKTALICNMRWVSENEFKDF